MSEDDSSKARQLLIDSGLFDRQEIGTGLLKWKVDEVNFGNLRVRLSDENKKTNKLFRISEQIVASEGIEILKNGSISHTDHLEEGSTLWYAAKICSYRRIVALCISRKDSDGSASAGFQLGRLVGQQKTRNLLEKLAETGIGFSKRQSEKGKVSGAKRREASYVDRARIESIGAMGKREGYSDRSLTGLCPPSACRAQESNSL